MAVKLDNTKLLSIFKSAVLVAALASSTGNVFAGNQNAPDVNNLKANPHLVKAVSAVKQLAKQSSPDLNIDVQYTNEAGDEEFGHALSDFRTKDCSVVLNNNFASTKEMQALQKYTGWDDEQMAIMFVAHEVQHCVTSNDVRRAVFDKEKLDSRTAQALHSYVLGESIAQKVAQNPNNEKAVRDLIFTAKNDSFGRASESISDISGLYLVQKLSKRGLTAESVEGLIKWREEFTQDKDYGRHYTVPALAAYLKDLRINELLGQAVSAETIAEKAYTIVSESLPAHGYTKVGVKALTDARDAFLTDTGPSL